VRAWPTVSFWCNCSRTGYDQCPFGRLSFLICDVRELLKSGHSKPEFSIWVERLRNPEQNDSAAPATRFVGQFDLVVAAVYDRRLYSYRFPALTERRYSKLSHYCHPAAVDRCANTVLYRPLRREEMRKVVQMLMVCALMLLSGISISGSASTAIGSRNSLPPKGNTEGYTGSSQRRPEQQPSRRARHIRGTRLPADRRQDSGGRQRQAICHRHRRIEEICPWSLRPQGRDYSYDIKAQFDETHGTGTRSEGLGIVAALHVRVREAAGYEPGGRTLEVNPSPIRFSWVARTSPFMYAATQFSFT